MKKLFKDSNLIFRIIFASTMGQKEKDGKKKIAPKLGVLLLGLLFVIFVAFITVSMTIVAAQYDDGSVAVALVGVAQLIVLIFGLIAAVDFLFFSKDTAILSTLPVSAMSIFLAKMAMVYVTELGLSAVISLPSLITYGIVKSLTVGFASVGVGYFIYSVLATFLIPLIPLLIIGVLAMPIMYLLSFIKKSEVANTVFGVIATVCIAGLSVGVQFALNPELGGAADDPASMMAFFNGMDKVFIFNYPLKMALSSLSAVSIGWFVAYIGVVLAAGTIAVLLSNFSYKRVLSKSLETGAGGSRKKKSKEASFKGYSFRKTFLLKEIRTFFKTPTLMIGFIMSFIMFPLMGVIFGFAFSQAGMEVEEEEMGFFLKVASQISFVMMLYIGFMLTCVTNMLATVGFSREGKNFRTLKTLPISGKTVTNLKLMLSFIQTGISSVLASIGMLITMIIGGADGASVALATVCCFIIAFVGGCGYDMMALSNDMRKINVSWQNIAQITKNNPAFMGLNFKVMLSGVVFLLIGIIVPLTLEMSQLAAIGMTAGVALIVALTFVVFGWLRLDKDPDKWFAEVEA